MANAKIQVYATSWCPDCDRIKEFLGKHQIDYEWIDVERDPGALRFIKQVNDGLELVPTLRFPDGTTLSEPSDERLAAKLGVPLEGRCPYYDLVIIGGGPAGLTAGIYAAREGMSTALFDAAALGGQTAITEWIDNYPGFPDGIGGMELADRMARQARRYGVLIQEYQPVVAMGTAGGYRWIRTDDGQECRARAVLIATGSSYKRLGVPGEEQYIGRGVSYCATCDGPFYKNEPVVVVGGGNSATEEGLYLTKFANMVTLLVRGNQLRASKILVDNVLSHPKMAVTYNTVVQEFIGNGALKGVRVLNKVTGETSMIEVPGVFVFIGLIPNTQFARGVVELDEMGFVVTSPTLETTVPGVFAAGDVRAGSTKQVASAAGEGVTAALMVRHYFKEGSLEETAIRNVP